MMKQGHQVLPRDDMSNGKYCVYCEEPTGAAEHRVGCVMRRRTVVVKFTVELVVEKPEDHDVSLIEFGYNESSWCADNLIEMLQEASERNGCLCDIVSAEYVREATEEDHEKWHYEWREP